MLGQIDTPVKHRTGSKSLISLDNARTETATDTPKKQPRIDLRSLHKEEKENSSPDIHFLNILSQLPYLGQENMPETWSKPTAVSAVVKDATSAEDILTEDLARMLQAKLDYIVEPSKKELAPSKTDKTSQFPPEDAPEPVKKAWESATVSMDLGEIRHLTALFHDTIDYRTLQPTPTVFSQQTDYASMVDRLIQGEKYLNTLASDDRKVTGWKLIYALESFKKALIEYKLY